MTMKTEEVIKVLENKLATLEMNKIAATNTGELATIVKVEQEIIETKDVIEKLQS